MSRLAFALGALVALAPVALHAQDQGSSNPSGISVQLRLAEELEVGKSAPAIIAPYATADGLGPADQPFDLAKELGRVVVLAFYPGDFTPGCIAEWQAFRDRRESLFGEGVEVVGISADSLESHVRFAREYQLPFKLVSDPDRRIAGSYSTVDGRRINRSVVVVGRDGIIRYIDPSFVALDPQSYSHLRAAIEAALKE